MLVSHGAVIKAHGDNNCHPLHYVCMRDANNSRFPTVAADTIKIIDYIVSLSDSEILSAEYRPQEDLLFTPLHLAVRAKNWKAVEHLQSLGAKLTDPGQFQYELWVSAADARGKLFRRFLDLGVSPAGKCPGHGNRTIIEYYFGSYMRENNTAGEAFEANLKALLKAGADINAGSCYYSWPERQHEDSTGLRVARDKGMDQSFVQVFLRNGAVENKELEHE
jgi:hypothetical protein